MRLHAQRHRGVINLPLTAREIQAVVFFKVGADGDVRVSMRSKGYDVDVRMVASEYGGGGHKNAAGFTVPGSLDAAAHHLHLDDGDRWRLDGGRPVNGAPTPRSVDKLAGPARRTTWSA